MAGVTAAIACAAAAAAGAPVAGVAPRAANVTMTLSVPRSELAAAAVGGLLVFAGGMAAGGPSDVVDVFDPAAGGAREVLRLSAPRAFDGGENVAAVCRGRAYFAGGAGPNGTRSAVVDVFDAATRRFLPPLTLSSGRSFLAATALDGPGVVLFGGGELAEDEAHPARSADTDVVDVWSAAEGRWLPPGRLSVGRKKLAAAAVAGRWAVFAGGFLSNNGSDGYRAEVDVYDAVTGAWAAAAPLAQGRMRLAAAAAGGCALFAGGEVNVSQNDASGVVDEWCPGGARGVAELSVRRYELAAAAGGGAAFFGGGNVGVGGSDAAGPARVDVYDPHTRAWARRELREGRKRLAAAYAPALRAACFAGGKGAAGLSAAVECVPAG